MKYPIFRHFSSLLICCLGLLLSVHPVAAQRNGLAAVVNGRPILKSEVDQLIVRQLRLIETQAPPAERDGLKSRLRKEALENLIDVEIILSEYFKMSGGQGIKPQYVNEEILQEIRTEFGGDEKKFHQALKDEGTTLKKHREMKEKMLIVQMMRSQKTKDTGFASPEKKEAFLKENAAQFRGKDKIKLRSITIPKIGDDVGTSPQTQKALIGEIRQRVLAGGEFASEAKLYSKDSHAEAGGDWGWIDDSVMSKQMSDDAFATATGGVSKVIEDEDNFYLFHVESRQQGKSRPKAEIDAEVEKMVILEQRRKAYDEWVLRLRGKATIKQF